MSQTFWSQLGPELVQCKCHLESWINLHSGSIKDHSIFAKDNKIKKVTQRMRNHFETGNGGNKCIMFETMRTQSGNNYSAFVKISFLAGRRERTRDFRDLNGAGQGNIYTKYGY